MAEEKKAAPTIDHFLGLISGWIEYIIMHTDNEVRRIKRKVLFFILLYGTLVFSGFLIILGGLKYAAEMLNFSEGLLYMIAGGVMIVLLALISLVARI